MDNYMKNYDFYLLMTDYLSEGRALREIYTSSDYMLQFRVTRFLEDCENRGFNEAMTEAQNGVAEPVYLAVSLPYAILREEDIEAYLA